MTGHLPQVTIRVFGGAGVTVGTEPVAIGGPRQRRLLALLTMQAGQVVSVDWLAEHLWDADGRPAETVPAIRVYMSRLRRAMPGDTAVWLATVASGYRLDAPPEAVEHLRFRMLRSEAAKATRVGDPRTAYDLLDEALGIWTGEPFPELDDLSVAQAELEQLRVDRHDAMEERWQAALELGRHTQITGELAAFTSEHGLRDRAVRQHALALHRSGRAGDGLAVLATHRRLLAEQTGLDPSPEAAELEHMLLSGADMPASSRRLRGYRLIEETAGGAFSIVWRGLQPSVDRQVAVKQIRSALAARPDFIRRFEAEARLVARLEHPHIVPLIDFWRDPDSAYLVMRWMRGGTLERRLEDGPLPLQATLTLVGQVGRALSSAHVRGVIHRDVKPANILLDEDGNAFLGDFGIAMVDAPTQSVDNTPSSPGTPAYASPEQRRGEPAGPPADVFSLGVVLAECLGGTVQIECSTAAAVFEQPLRERALARATRHGDVPEHVLTALERATAHDPIARFQTVSGFLAALGDAPMHVATPGAVIPSVDDPPNPYVGLRAFDDGDAPRFHGRERLVEELVDQLRDSAPPQSVVLVGPSGSGKSSVVRAGLLPALRSGRIAGSDQWFVTTMVPAADPFSALAAALLRVAVAPPEALPEILRDGPEGVLQGVRACLGGSQEQVLVIVDQFEELFTTSRADVANAFLTALAHAAQAPESPLRLVLTVRADQYDLPLQHPAFATVVSHSAVEVTPLSGDELERAIERPAGALGLRFEAGLVARIATEAAGRTGSLPLLQYALAELFDRRTGALLTTAAYEEMGGLTGALASRADALWLDADDEERVAARRLFGRLASLDEDRTDLRRRVPIADLSHDPATRTVMRRYGDARLLTFDRDVTSRAPTVEVSHEALLREWPRLARWLEDDRETLRSVARVAAAADVWDAGGRDSSDLHRGVREETSAALATAHPDRLRPLDHAFVEASSNAATAAQDEARAHISRLRRLVVGTAVALVVAMAAGAVAVVQQRRADDEAARARDAAAAAIDASEEAELQTLLARSASQVDQDPDLAILLALEAHRRAPGPRTDGAVLNALGAGRSASKIASVPIVGDLDRCPYVATDATGLPQFGVVEGQLAIGGPTDDHVTLLGPAPADCVYWQADVDRNRWFALAPGEPGRLFHGRFGQEFTLVRDLMPFDFVVDTAFLVGGRLALLESDVARVSVIDAATGDQVGTGVTGEFFGGGKINAAGTLVGVGLGNPSSPSQPGQLVVLDAITGDPVLEVPTDAPALAVDFDDAAGQVVTVMDGGRVIWVDLDTGEVVHDAQLANSATLQQLRVLDDGRVAVTSNHSVEVVDPANDTTRSIPVRDVEEVAVTATGRIRATSSDDRWETYAIDGNALTQAAIAVETRGSVTIDDGRAIVSYPPAQVAEEIDLSTGTRRDLELSLPGDGLLLAGVPHDDGLWAIGVEPLSLTHWRDGDMVAQVDLESHLFPSPLDRITLAEGRDEATMLLWIGETGLVINLEPTAARVLQRFGPAEIMAAVSATDGGVQAMSPDGLVTTMGPDGAVLGMFETHLLSVRSATPDPASDQFHVNPVFRSGVVTVDPATQETRRLSVGQVVSSIGVVGDDVGTLVLTTDDGGVRLWDIATDRLVGIAYQGAGTTGTSSDQWHDLQAQTSWVVTGGQLLEIPLDPDVWIETACRAVGRNLSVDEWRRFVPGTSDPTPACDTQD